MILAKSFTVAFISAARSGLTIKSTSFPPNGELSPPAREPVPGAEVVLEVEMALLLAWSQGKRPHKNGP